MEPQPDKHLCPRHTAEYRRWLAARPALFYVYSEETEEYALPDREGWTKDRTKAGRYTDEKGDKAAQTMMGGERWAISLVPVNP
jgi:hypothetical protein